MDQEAKKSGEAKNTAAAKVWESPQPPTDSPRGNVMRRESTSSSESMTYPTRFESSEEFQLPRELAMANRRGQEVLEICKYGMTVCGCKSCS